MPRRLLPLLVITSLALLLLWPGLWLQRLFVSGDNALVFYPWRVIAARMVHQGQWPVWTDLVQAGFPLLAEPQAALLYPINAVLYLVLPAAAAHNYGLLLHFILAGAFTFWFGRNLGMSRAGALAAALAFAFIADIRPYAADPASAVLTWMPLLFLVAHRTASAVDVGQGWAARAAYGGLLAAGIVAIQVFAGDPQVGLITVYAALAYAFFLALIISISRRTGDLPRTLGAALVFSAIMGMAGLALSAAQLAPTLELTRASLRGQGVGSALAGQGSAFPLSLATAVWPNFSLPLGGAFTIASHYMGLVPLVGVIVAILALRRAEDWPDGLRRQALFFLAMGLAAYLLSLGRFTSLYGLSRMVPGLNLFRLPDRYSSLTLFALIIVGGIGITLLSRVRGADSRLPLLSQRAILLIAATFFAMLLGANVVLSLFGGRLKEAMLAYSQREVYGQEFHVQPWEYYQQRVEGIYSQVSGAVRLDSPVVVRHSAMILAILVLLTLWRAGRLRGVNVGPLLVGVLAVEIALSGELRPAGVPLPLLNPSAVSALKERQAGGDAPVRFFRDISPEMVSQSFAELLPTLPESFNGVFDIPSVGVYAPLSVKRAVDLLDPLGAIDTGLGRRPTDESQLYRSLEILAAAGVDHILSRRSLQDGRLQTVQIGDDGVRVYRLLTALPRAHLVAVAVPATDAAEALQKVRGFLFRPSELVVVEGYAGALPQFEKGPSRTAIVHAGPGHVQIDVESALGGYLVLADTYYPGWKASVDGQETPIYPANELTRAVLVPAGRHQVDFRYEPASVKSGLAISAATLVLWAGTVLFLYLRLRSAIRSS